MRMKGLDCLLRNVRRKSFLLCPYEIFSKYWSLLLWCRVSLWRGILPPGTLETCGLGFACRNDCWGLEAWSLFGDQDHVTWWDVSHTRPVAPALETLLWYEWIVMGNLKMLRSLYLGWSWTKPKHTGGARGQRNSWHLGHTGIEDFDDAYSHHVMNLFLSSFVTALVYFLICHLHHNKLFF